MIDFTVEHKASGLIIVTPVSIRAKIERHKLRLEDWNKPFVLDNEDMARSLLSSYEAEGFSCQHTYYKSMEKGGAR